MAEKTIKTTKDKLVGLLNATDQVPASKLASDLGKHLSFRKVLKTHLQEYIDTKAEAQNKFRDEQRRVQDLLNPLQEKLNKLPKENLTPEQEAEKAKLTEEQNKLNAVFSKFITVENDKLAKVSDNLKVQKVEAKFDNEAFLFEKAVIMDNAAIIFKAGDDKINADFAENIYDLFDSAE